jgi:hypothetical protein
VLRRDEAIGEPRGSRLLLLCFLLAGVACGGATAPIEPGFIESRTGSDSGHVEASDGSDPNRRGPIADCVYQACMGLELCLVGETCPVGDGCNACTCEVLPNGLTVSTCTTAPCSCP